MSPETQGDTPPFPSLFDFEDRTVVVTGAANGIGAACARRFAELQASVVLVDRDEHAVRRLADTLPRTAAFAIDITTPGAADAIVEHATGRFGPVHALVNSAGIFPHAPTLDASMDEWDAVMAVNLRSTFALARACAHTMTMSGGAIVNIASHAARRPSRGMAAYSASKGGVVSLTRALAIDLGPSIRVNAVAPGPITDTAGARAGLPEDHERAESMLAARAASLPAGRTGRSDDVACLVVYLASDAASFMTGQIVTIDGGRSLV